MSARDDDGDVDLVRFDFRFYCCCFVASAITDGWDEATLKGVLVDHQCLVF